MYLKRILFAIFLVSVLLLFFWLWIARDTLGFNPRSTPNVRTIVPNSATPQATQQSGSDQQLLDDSRDTPYIFLNLDETFIQAVSWDINKDGSTDQICAVKKAAEPYIHLIIGIQNPIDGEYHRVAELRTGVTQVRTLSFSFMDITGERVYSLIYTGMTSDNQRIMAVHNPEFDRDGRLSFRALADLRSDGPITIQEVTRPDAYNLGLASGVSFPIITYSSDPDSPQALDQIERTWRWNRALRRYELASENRIPGKRIETRLISQLRSGNQESFDAFLSGLWFTPSTRPNDFPRYIFFDVDQSEIIFYTDNKQEVFYRESASPRRYGMFVASRNRSISSIRRLIDIELTGIDEIKLTVMDDVRLNIGVASDWDGIYRKMAPNLSLHQGTSWIDNSNIGNLLTEHSEPWLSPEGYTFTITGSNYRIESASQTETGILAVLSVRGETVLQLRSTDNTSSDRFYTANLEQRRGTGESILQTLTMKQVQVSLIGIQSTEHTSVQWQRTITPEQADD